MSRTPEVEAAMRNVESGVGYTDHSDTLAIEVKRLEAENAKLRVALEEIARYDQSSSHGEGVCPYGCDTPHIAKRALNSEGATP